MSNSRKESDRRQHTRDKNRRVSQARCSRCCSVANSWDRQHRMPGNKTNNDALSRNADKSGSECSVVSGHPQTSPAIKGWCLVVLESLQEKALRSKLLEDIKIKRLCGPERTCVGKG